MTFVVAFVNLGDSTLEVELVDARSELGAALLLLEDKSIGDWSGAESLSDLKEKLLDDCDVLIEVITFRKRKRL